VIVVIEIKETLDRIRGQ